MSMKILTQPRSMRPERMVVLRSSMPVQLVTLRHTVPLHLSDADLADLARLGDPVDQAAELTSPKERPAPPVGGDAR